MLSQVDLDWLKWNYPGVYYVRSKNILQGCLWFRMGYSFSTGEGIINPADGMSVENCLILEDVYDLTIEIDPSRKQIVVKEVGGRITHTKNRWKFGYVDVHMYRDGSLCLCPEPEEKLLFHEGFSLQKLFYNYLIPYLYYQTYVGKFGKEPWRSSSHGEVGILESYARQRFSGLPLNSVIDAYVGSLPSPIKDLVAAKGKIDENLLCPCGSRKKFRDCHPLGLAGLKRLQEDYRLAKTTKNHKAVGLPASPVFQ